MPEGNPSCFVAAVGYCHPLDKKKRPAPEVPSGSFAVPDPNFPLGISLHVDVKTTKQPKNNVLFQRLVDITRKLTTRISNRN
jgi:hypothetical protein